jgi:hypothetical protein
VDENTKSDDVDAGRGDVEFKLENEIDLFGGVNDEEECEVTEGALYMNVGNDPHPSTISTIFLVICAAARKNGHSLFFSGDV